MIKNYYYLAAGILAIVFAITHALNGQNTVLPLLQFLIAALLIIRWIVIFGTTLFYTPGALKNILVDTIAIAIYVTLIILGTKARAKHAKV